MKTDGGGEYVNAEFARYLFENNSEHETSIPHKHEQHGVAERMNRTIVEKVRCMLIQADLPKWLWGARQHYYVTRGDCRVQWELR